MRKKTLFIVLCLLSGILTLGGCGKSETDDAKTQKSEAKEEDEWEETPVAPIEKEDLKKIGVPLKGTVEIKLENNTGKSITGFAVKKSENSEFGENLLEDEDVYVKGEKRYFYYDYKQENSEEETETISADYDGNTEEETDESVPEYDIQITYLNGTTAVLHDFPFDDMKEGTLELEDEITYLTYTSIKTKKEVDTKDEERSIRTKEETAAAEAQRKANEAAAAEAKRQAAEAAAAKQQAEAAAAEAQKQAQAAAEIRGEELGNVGFFGAENLRCHVNAGKKNVSVTYEADTIAGFGGFKWTLKTEGSSKVIRPVKWIRRLKAAKEVIGITGD